MTMSSDAAEQIVRLPLEGFEVAAKAIGEMAKDICIYSLISVPNRNQKTKEEKQGLQV